MPIKGLSQKRRWLRVGKIRLGEKKVSPKSGKEYPAKSDHFIFDPDDPALMEPFVALYGDKPTRITVAFPCEDPEVVFPQYYCLYAASGLLCKGDGETAVRRTEDGALADIDDCPGPDSCDFAGTHGVGGRPGCKRLARLQFFIPDLPVMGTIEVATTSYNSIVNLNSGLDLLRNIAGRISLIPVDLVLRGQQATNPENQKAVNIYVMHLVIPVGLRQVQESLRPLLAYDGMAGLAPSQALPDDLYARSQVRGLPAPATTEVEGVTVDADTGEVLEDRGAEAPRAPDVPPSTVHPTPEVIAALDAAAFPPAKREALVASAIEGKWSTEQFLGIIAQQGGGAGSGTRADPKATAPAQAPTSQPAAPVPTPASRQAGQKALF